MSSYHRCPDAPATSKRWDSTNHWDARRLAARVRDWMAAHPKATMQSLSEAAGLGTGYVSHLLNDDAVEVQGDKARRLLAAMRRGGA